jgi:hypothetical protein
MHLESAGCAVGSSARCVREGADARRHRRAQIPAGSTGAAGLRLKGRGIPAKYAGRLLRRIADRCAARRYGSAKTLYANMATEFKSFNPERSWGST